MSGSADKLRDLFSGLFAKLMEFTIQEEFLNSLGESLEVFYDLKAEEEYEFIPTNEFLFLTWFLLDDIGVIGENGCLMDEFIRRKADVLSIQEMQICKALEDTSLNLLEVKGCVPGKSMTLRDAFTGETFEVEESMGNGDVAEIGNILFTRVLKLGDMYFLVGAGIFLDKSLKEYITQDFTKAYQDACEEGDHCSFKDFLKRNGFLLNHWIKAYERGELTDDGDDGDDDEPSDGEDDGKDKEK